MELGRRLLPRLHAGLRTYLLRDFVISCRYVIPGTSTRYEPGKYLVSGVTQATAGAYNLMKYGSSTAAVDILTSTHRYVRLSGVPIALSGRRTIISYGCVRRNAVTAVEQFIEGRSSKATHPFLLPPFLSYVLVQGFPPGRAWGSGARTTGTEKERPTSD